MFIWGAERRFLLESEAEPALCTAALGSKMQTLLLRLPHLLLAQSKVSICRNKRRKRTTALLSSAALNWKRIWDWRNCTQVLKTHSGRQLEQHLHSDCTADILALTSLWSHTWVFYSSMPYNCSIRSAGGVIRQHGWWTSRQLVP